MGELDEAALLVPVPLACGFGKVFSPIYRQVYQYPLHMAHSIQHKPRLPRHVAVENRQSHAELFL
jgi:hypothetical protein